MVIQNLWGHGVLIVHFLYLFYFFSSFLLAYITGNNSDEQHDTFTIIGSWHHYCFFHFHTRTSGVFVSGYVLHHYQYHFGVGRMDASDFLLLYYFMPLHLLSASILCSHRMGEVFESLSAWLVDSGREGLFIMSLNMQLIPYFIIHFFFLGCMI
jgi:hypothetical protein